MSARITKRITKWLWLLTAGWCLVVMAPAYAAIDEVNPAEGTVGSEFTIYGSDFGNKRGKVDLGDESCRVLFWSDTEIICEVKKAQPAGEYEITVNPQGSKKKSVPMVSACPLCDEDAVYRRRRAAPSGGASRGGHDHGGLFRKEERAGRLAGHLRTDPGGEGSGMEPGSDHFPDPRRAYRYLHPGCAQRCGSGHPAVLVHLHPAPAKPLENNGNILHQRNPRECDGRLFQQRVLDL